MSLLIGSGADYAGVFIDGTQEAAYVTKVLATNPLFYPTLGEHEGAVAYDQIDPNQNGTHTAVTLGNAGIGDGQVCPLYDGAASYTDVYSATLAGRFDPNGGTLAAWVKVKEAGVWTDGTLRYAVRLAVDGNNEVYFFKAAANDLLYTGYDAGGVAKAGAGHAISGTGWYHFALTWSTGADEVMYYRDGVQIGATLNGLGAWAGALNSATTVVGAGSTVPANGWSGYIAHVALWGSALAPGVIANLATV